MQGRWLATIHIRPETVCCDSIPIAKTNAMKRKASGGSLARMSAYGRPMSGLTEKTAMGGMLTVAGVAMAALLFVSELVQYLRGRVVHEMNVFNERKDELHVHLDVSMLSMPCHLLVVGATEGTGEVLHRADSGLEWSLLDNGGRRVGPYVRTAVHPHAGGCRLRGEIKVGRIAGALRFLVQENPMLAFRKAGKNGLHQNTSHVIEKLRFGPSYKGMVNPMEGLKQVEVEKNGSWTYFLKLVPTTYQSRWKTKETNQYSMTEFFNQAIGGDSQAPHLTISYEMSPYSIKMKEENIGFGHFLVRVCAVVGGTYAFTRMLDRWLYLLTSCPHAHSIPSSEIQALHTQEKAVGLPK
mmetsp:Transcript_9125/g.55494  ORF Transcript_9125/g.55494 Transcript_9125/m.55494 type:complete len:353 (+) Transcript_9125:2-1060(+)